MTGLAVLAVLETFVIVGDPPGPVVVLLAAFVIAVAGATLTVQVVQRGRARRAHAERARTRAASRAWFLTSVLDPEAARRVLRDSPPETRNEACRHS
ncbi:hypothetical protein DP939_12325 [Spongiactinospora rosea]|uniref:Uncharacterized protein n=1 Tax=Spongiactinospora rosea TaxID=2248750 RepID=A0A366LZZ8_9ACTN|nr:hypothetical protein [Spongiactinospora rosea]RBQ19535.1 hypothetical protein DP939_12325 [Spongiactinospora rosea]